MSTLSLTSKPDAPQLVAGSPMGSTPSGSGSLEATLEELKIPALIQQIEQNTGVARLVPEKLANYGFVYERQGLKAFRQFIANHEQDVRQAILDNFHKSFVCWHAIALLPDEPAQPLNGYVSVAGARFVEAAFRDEPLPVQLMLGFRLAVSGLLAERIVVTRQDLRKFHLPLQINPQDNWPTLVRNHIFSAFILLVHKDIQQASASLDTLRKVQADYEERYLESIEDADKQTSAALELLGFYHLVQLLTLVIRHLQEDKLESDEVKLRLDQHYEAAIEAFDAGHHSRLMHFSHLLWAACHALVSHDPSELSPSA